MKQNQAIFSSRQRQSVDGTPRKKPPLPRPLRVLRAASGSLAILCLVLAATVFFLDAAGQARRETLLIRFWDADTLLWCFLGAAVLFACGWAWLQFRRLWCRILTAVVSAGLFLACGVCLFFSVWNNGTYSVFPSPAGTHTVVVHRYGLHTKSVVVYQRMNPFYVRTLYAQTERDAPLQIEWTDENTLSVSGGGRPATEISLAG